MRDGTIDGMPGGYFGVGIDTFGNFLNNLEDRTGYPNGTNPEGNNSLLPNEIGLRGPGSGQTGYYVLAGTGIDNYTNGNVAIASLNATTQNLQFPSDTERPDQDAEDFRSMSVVLAANDTVSVYLQVGYNSTMNLLFSANLSGYGTRPSELGFGFGASTGSDDEVIEIRNVVVTSSGSADTWYWSNQDPSVPEQWNDTSTLNWIGNDTVPGIGAGEYGTVAFNNTDNLTGNYLVNISGTPKTVGSINFSGNGSYTVTSNITGNAAIDFNTNGDGPSIISILNNPNGNANQTIAANMSVTGNNALAVQNYVSTTLTLSGNLNLNANNASYDTTGNIVDSGSISGTGNVTIGDNSGAGIGQVLFSGNNTYTGPTTIDTNATLVIASANALGGTGNGTTITNGGALGLEGNVTFAAEPLTLNGTGGPIYDSGALVNVSGNNTWTGNISMVGNSTIGAEAGSLTISSPIASSGGNYGVTFDVDSGATLTDTGNIAGNTSTITKTDGGTAILSGNNSTTGNVFVEEGVLQANGNSSLGNGSNTTVSSGATLAMGGAGSTYLGKTITLNGQGVSGEAGLWNAAGNNTWGNSTVGNITLGSDSSIGAASNTTLTVNSTIQAGTSNITFGGGNGTVQINQAIASTSNMSNVTISSGTLTANGTGLLVSNGTLKVASGGTLNMTAGNENVGALTGAGAISLGSRTFTFGSGNVSTTYSGTITSTNSTVGTIIQTGTANLTLSGSAGAISANTYKLSGGELVLGSADVISSTTDLNLAGGTLDMNGMQDIFSNLTLSANSVVDYVGLTGGNLAAAVSGTIVAPTANLTVDNWAGGYTNIAGGTVIGGNNNLLYFSNVTNTTNLNTLAADTSFAGWGNGTLISLGNNTYEIVPLLAGSNDFYWRGNGGSIWGNTTWTLGNGTASVGPNGAGTTAIFGDTDGSSHTVSNTTIQMSSGRTVGSMIFTETSAADAYKIQSSSGTAETLTLQGNGTSNAFITVSGNQTNVIGSNSTDRVNLTLASNLTIQNNDSNAAGLTLGNTSGTTELFTNGGCTTTVTGTGNTVIDMTMSGTGGLIDSSTGNLVLNEANTYTGNTALNSGFLQLGNATAVGNGTSNLTIAGGNLGAIGGNRTIANAYFVSGSFGIGNVDGSNLSLSGNGVLGAGNETLTVASGLWSTLSGVVSGAGNLTVAGPGNLTLNNGNNSFSGNFGVSGGNVYVGVGNTSAAGNTSLGLTIGAASAGQNELGTGNVSVTGGELQFAPNTSFNGTTTLASGESLTVNGTGVLNLSNGNTGTNDNFVDNGTITDSSTGNSTIHVNGTYTMNAGSGLTVNAGTLNLTPNGGFTTNGNATASANITTSGGSTLNINTSGGAGNFNLGANDSLTSNGTGTVVNITANSSTGQINFNGTVVVTNGGEVVVSANDTVLGGGPVLMNGGNASTAGTLVVQAGNLTVDASSNHTLAFAPNVQFNGNSTLYGGAANTSITNFGTITINHGTLTLDANTVDNLQGSGIVIQNGGTLLSGASNQIDNNTPMTLNNGTWNTAGNSEVLGTLTLSASSTINLGNGASIINYANSSAEPWVTGGVGGAGLLYITNWSGNVDGGGTDQLIFGSSNTSLTAAQLDQIVFVNPFGNVTDPGIEYNATILSDGEVVPDAVFVPVPEPGTWAGGGSLAVLAAWWEWRRRKRLAAGQ
ncbi:MAG: autotransporter-associated beta strand repeat-containing protein [Opitutales bacterium]|jgi:autotransporter-associated beta strand protein